MTHPPVLSGQRPSLALLGAEPFRAAVKLARHKVGRRRQQQPGDGHPVVSFPGLGAHRSSLATLRKHCQSSGYEAFDWRQGFNTGPQYDLDIWLANLHSKVAAMLMHPAKPATLIGWSLGRAGAGMSCPLSATAWPGGPGLDNNWPIHMAPLVGAQHPSTAPTRPRRSEMSLTDANTPRHPGRNEPDDPPDSLPVEPDEGPVPAFIPEDPEQQRVVQPED